MTLTDFLLAMALGAGAWLLLAALVWCCAWFVCESIEAALDVEGEAE